MKAAEQSQLEMPPEGPKIITAASPATYPAGGPQHNLYQLSDVFEPSEEESLPQPHKEGGIVSDMLQDLGLPTSFPKTTTRLNPGDERVYSRPLDASERQGVYIFFGILLGSWIAGGLATPASSNKNVKQR